MTKIKFTVSEIKGECSNGMKVGDHFFLEDYKLSIPDGNSVCIWALNKMILSFPLLLEREDIQKEHWIKDQKTTSCADGKVKFSIETIKI